MNRAALLPLDYEWRYLACGVRRHAVGRHSPKALCGTDAWASTAWRGTGSQDEYEKCAALPPCKKCTRLLDGPLRG